MGRGLPAAAADAAKTSWPELVGQHFVVAMAVIKAEREDVGIKLLGTSDDPPGDFNDHRVCLFVDDTAHVAKTPVVG
ncbi:hypothetical protein EJB05_25422, partial [Eragrostis curvula]